MDVHDNKHINVITINKKQAQLLLLNSRSFITVLRKESVRQSSEGPRADDWRCEHADANYIVWPDGFLGVK